MSIGRRAARTTTKAIVLTLLARAALTFKYLCKDFSYKTTQDYKYLHRQENIRDLEER